MALDDCNAADASDVSAVTGTLMAIELDSGS
jgi:hypothetical protein